MTYRVKGFLHADFHYPGQTEEGLYSASWPEEILVDAGSMEEALAAAKSFLIDMEAWYTRSGTMFPGGHSFHIYRKVPGDSFEGLRLRPCWFEVQRRFTIRSAEVAAEKN